MILYCLWSMLLIGHIWSDDQPVRYTNWAVGQPDSYNGLEACVEMDPITGYWSDKDCNKVKDVVCKMKKGRFELS